MTEQLILFETAKLAKEKGLCEYFNKGTEYVSAFYSEDGINFEETEFQQEDCIIEDRYFRPTQSLLQRWLREVHNINITIPPSKRGYFISIGFINTHKNFDEIEPDGYYLVYKDALEIGLQEGLKLI